MSHKSVLIHLCSSFSVPLFSKPDKSRSRKASG